MGGINPFPNGDCLSKCATIDWKEDEQLVTTSTAQTHSTGNCRLYWAGQAGTTTDKTSACENAGPLSTVCQ
jgi:hypothetical protein